MEVNRKETDKSTASGSSNNENDVNSTENSHATAVANITCTIGTTGKWLQDLVSNAVEAYTAELREAPVRTKAITSCAIAMLGELIGTQLKPRKPDGSRETVSLRRMAVFAGYGLAITGPFFHWWYGTLERAVGGLHLTSPHLVALVKVAVTQLVMTPPFLVFTLGFIQYFLTLDVNDTVRAVKNRFAAALFLNWRVWTVAQAVNFQVVPLEYRVLFGNMVALWWNIYLSLVSHGSQ